MCTITLNINESQIRKANPSLTDIDSITKWVQHLMDKCIADLAADSPAKEDLEPYTIEELHARIAESERQFAEGKYSPIEKVFEEWNMGKNNVLETA